MNILLLSRYTLFTPQFKIKMRAARGITTLFELDDGFPYEQSGLIVDL